MAVTKFQRGKREVGWVKWGNEVTWANLTFSSLYPLEKQVLLPNLVALTCFMRYLFMFSYRKLDYSVVSLVAKPRDHKGFRIRTSFLYFMCKLQPDQFIRIPETRGWFLIFTISITLHINKKTILFNHNYEYKSIILRMVSFCNELIVKGFYLKIYY